MGLSTDGCSKSSQLHLIAMDRSDDAARLDRGSRPRLRPHLLAVATFWTAPRARLAAVVPLTGALLLLLAAAPRQFWDFAAFFGAGHLAPSTDLLSLEPVVRWQLASGLPSVP